MEKLHVAPVYLVADWDVLRLFQFEQGEISSDHQQRLVELLAPLFAEEGMVLQYQSDLCWQLELPQKAQIQTTPLDWATGINLNEAMPSGAEALRWKQLLNEVQMMLHAAPMESQAEQLAVNGVWIWRDPSLLDRLAYWWQQR